VTNPVMAEELAFDPRQEKENSDRMRAQLIPEQVSWFEEIIKAVEQYDCHSHGNHSTGFFLKGAARTGKTFVYNCLCSDL